jgi:hypothetical protein
MKRVSLSSLSVNAPPESKAAETPKAPRGGRKSSSTSNQVIKITSDQDNGRVQVAFRMDKDAYKDLKRMALDEDTTVNELMVRAINELRERKGLKKLDG